MKTKIINKIIRSKIDGWLKTIEDPVVRELASNNTIVTGGCIASMLLREPVNDYDVYFRDYLTTLAVARYYVKRFGTKNKAGIECAISIDTSEEGRVKIVVKSAGIASENGTEVPYQYFEAAKDGAAGEYVHEIVGDAGTAEELYEDTEKAALATADEPGKPKYRPIFLSTNAITLSHKLQLVLRFIGEPDVIHENYDFAHCTNYWTSWNSKLTLRTEALECLLTKELRYQGSKYPVCSIMRLRKFIARGWTVNAGQIIKMIMQIDALDLTDMDTLREQLTGVDSAYFSEVIHKLHDKDPTKIDRAYLIEVIGAIF